MNEYYRGYGEICYCAGCRRVGDESEFTEINGMIYCAECTFTTDPTDCVEVGVCAECQHVGDRADFTEIGGLIYCTECVFS